MINQTVNKLKALKNRKGAIGIIIAICIVIFLLILLIAFAAAIIGSHQGANSTGGLITGTDTGGCTGGKLPQSVLDLINQNKPVYQAAAKAEGIDWEMLAAVHYREATNNPNGSLMSGEKIGTVNPDNGKTYNTLYDSAVAAAQSLKSRVNGLRVGSDSDTIKKAFLGHNRGDRYTKGGCSLDSSPYVMNQFDAAHTNMAYPSNLICEPKSTAGRTETKLGAFTVYSILKGNIAGSATCTQTSGPAATGSCADILPAAEKYFGLNYSQASHCGPNTIGPAGVTAVDCSGYVSRVYRDIGIASKNWCTRTATIPNDSTLVLITNDLSRAPQLAQQGDLILTGSHVVIYVNNNTVYASRGETAGGPQKETVRSGVWNVKNLAATHGWVGLYRAKACTLQQPAALIQSAVNNALKVKK